MKIEISKCEHCRSKNIYKVEDGFIICLDCRAYMEIDWYKNKLDKLSFWIYKREILSKLKRKEKYETTK